MISKLASFVSLSFFKDIALMGKTYVKTHDVQAETLTMEEERVSQMNIEEPYMVKCLIKTSLPILK